MKANRVLLVSVAAVAGALAGWQLALRHVEGQKTALFSPNPFHRLAALSYLAGRARPETVWLLRDYILWEAVAPLRRRAVRLVRRLELELG